MFGLGNRRVPTGERISVLRADDLRRPVGSDVLRDVWRRRPGSDDGIGDTRHADATRSGTGRAPAARHRVGGPRHPPASPVAGKKRSRRRVHEPGRHPRRRRAPGSTQTGTPSIPTRCRERGRQTLRPPARTRTWHDAAPATYRSAQAGRHRRRAWNHVMTLGVELHRRRIRSVPGDAHRDHRARVTQQAGIRVVPSCRAHGDAGRLRSAPVGRDPVDRSV